MDRLWIPLAVLAAVVLQTTLVPAVFCGVPAPDLVFLVVVFLALQRRSTLGIWTAFWAGLMQDAAGGGPLGLNAVMLLVAAYWVGLLRARFFKENYSAQVLILVLLTCAQQFFMFFWMNAVQSAGYHLGVWTTRALLMSLYHALLGPALIRGLGRLIRGEDVYRNLIAGHGRESGRLNLSRPG